MKWFISLFLISWLAVVSPHPSHAEEENTKIIINLWNRTLRLEQNNTLIKKYSIGPGAKDTPSPVGIYKVVRKAKNWGSGFGSRWMEINVPWGIYGIHGTNRPGLIGRYVSHGCIRMRNKDIEDLYKRVKVGVPVIIEGPLSGHKDLTYRILVHGSRGTLVQIVQNRLQAAGFYKGPCHGKFDRNTEIAVIMYQKANGLPVTAQIHYEDLLHLGIME